MKTALFSVFIMLALALAGCLETVPFTQFSPGGVTLGTPRKVDGHYFLPISFTPALIESARWLYDVRCRVRERQIYVTAVYTTPVGLSPSRYAGGVTLNGVQGGRYSVVYHDPDGRDHSLGHIDLP